MTKLASIGKGTSTLAENTGEDFIDTLVSSIVYDEGQEKIKKISEMVDTGNKHLDEALEDALTGATYSIMNSVTITLTQFALSKSIVILSAIVLYLKGTSASKKFSNGIKSLFSIGKKTGNPVGKALGTVGGILFGSEQQNIAIAQMVNDSSNTLIKGVSDERQNQILMHNHKKDRVEKEKDRYYQTYNSKNQQKMKKYEDKFLRGAWKKTEKDKKLYFDVTGQDPKKVNFNKDYVAELNKYSQFVTTAKGEIYGTTKAILDLLTTNGVVK